MYQGRTPRVLNTSLALIALAFAVCNVASAASSTGANPIFSYQDFSGSPSVHPTGNVVISGSRVNMTDGISHHGGGLWYNTVQNIQSFTTQFTFTIQGEGGYGMVFCIQNSNSTTNPGNFGINAGAVSANGIGYGGGGAPLNPARIIALALYSAPVHSIRPPGMYLHHRIPPWGFTSMVVPR